MPQRKSFWLYDNDQVKYRTPFYWSLSLALSVISAAFGSLVAWAVVDQYTSRGTVDIALIAVAAAFLATTMIELPAALIFFYRRWRGEITGTTGYFDYEIVNDTQEDPTNGVHHGPDHC